MRYSFDPLMRGILRGADADCEAIVPGRGWLYRVGSKVRIRHILPGFGRLPVAAAEDSMSGIVGVAHNLATEQAKRGWDATLVGLSGEASRSATRTWPGGLCAVPIRPWRWCKLKGYDFSYLAPVAARLLLDGRADIHHVYSNPYLLAVGRAGTRLLHYQTPINAVPPAYHRAVGRARAVVCCSEFVRHQFLRHVRYPEDGVRVVYNGVDPEHFRPGEKQASRARLGIGEGKAVVLFAGQVSEEKGLLHLVRACRSLAPDLSFQLVVAGSSKLWGGADRAGPTTPYERKVSEEARSLETVFLGRLPFGEMPEVYRAADIFVCPSVWDEPFGMVNLEAMATGLPVVATEVGGIPEVVVKDETGLVVPPEDERALAQALRTLLHDPHLRLRLGEAGQRRAQGFSWEALAHDWERIYDEARAGSSRRAHDGRLAGGAD